VELNTQNLAERLRLVLQRYFLAIAKVAGGTGKGRHFL